MNEAVYKAMAPLYASLVSSGVYELSQVPHAVLPYVMPLLKVNSA